MESNLICFNKKDFKIISKDIVFKGYFRIIRYKLKIKLFNGSWGKTVVREVFDRGNAVALLPYDPVNKKIVLIEQFRIGAISKISCFSPWLLEPIAGVIGSNESFERAILRESKEEAGLKILKLVHICDYLVSPGGCTENVSLFLGRVDTKSILTKFHGVRSESEDIKIHVLDIRAARELLFKNKVSNSMCIIALQWFFLNDISSIFQ